MINQETDGINHINIYSQGKTKLGRFLSNFSFHPIITEDGRFNSIEGYWYWLSCKNDKLRDLSGFSAKIIGRELGGKDWIDTDEFKRKIKDAISIKIISSNFRCHFEESVLPFKHYYIFNGKKIVPKDGKWIIYHIEKLRKELKC